MRQTELNSCIAKTVSKRRDKLAIIAEVLEITEEGALKTPIMHKANLGFKSLNEYLKFMLKLKLIDKVANAGKDVYVTTEKGLDFLQHQRALADLLKNEGEKQRKP
jgi:predicted transcriptional regulator